MNNFEACMTDGGFTLVKKRTKYKKKYNYNSNKITEFKYKKIKEKSNRLTIENIIDNIISKK